MSAQPCLSVDPAGLDTYESAVAYAKKHGLAIDPEAATLALAPPTPDTMGIRQFLLTPHAYGIPAVLAILGGAATFVVQPHDRPHDLRRTRVAAGSVVRIEPAVVHTMDVRPGDGPLVSVSLYDGGVVPPEEAMAPLQTPEACLFAPPCPELCDRTLRIELPSGQAHIVGTEVGADVVVVSGSSSSSGSGSGRSGVSELRMAIPDTPRPRYGVLVGPPVRAWYSEGDKGAGDGLAAQCSHADVEVIAVGDDVAASTLDKAVAILDSMMGGMPEWVRARLKGGRVAVMGEAAVTTDVPGHTHLRGLTTDDGRDFDAGTRGLGGTVDIPVTSVGGENITQINDTRYSQESILIHEFAHHIMDVGLEDTLVFQDIEDAYAAAQASGEYTPDCYAISCKEEYWAEGVQAWFNASVRTDVNSGINTRDSVRARDPALAAVCTFVFGSDAPHNLWTCAHPL